MQEVPLRTRMHADTGFAGTAARRPAFGAFD